MAICVFAATASAQTTDKLYGYQLNGSRNLRFTEAEKVHTEVALGAFASFGSEAPVGAGVSLDASRVYTPSRAFAWRWGGLVSGEYAGKYGLLADAFGQVGLRFGRGVSFGIDALAGVGQMSFLTTSTNGESIHQGYNSVWRPKVGGQINVMFNLGKRAALSVFGRYTHAFNDSGAFALETAEGWTNGPTVFHGDKIAVGASVIFNLNQEAQLSGDNCWMGGIFSGYSFLGNEGIIAGAELLHFKRVSARGGRVLGLGAEQVFASNGASANTIFGKAGYQILPSGAGSVIVFEVGVKAGLGEYGKAAQGQTDTESFSMRSSMMSVGVVGKGYVGINFHFGRHNIKLAGEGGYHTCFGADFSGSNGYAGSTSKLHGADAAVTAGYSFAF